MRENNYVLTFRQQTKANIGYALVEVTLNLLLLKDTRLSLETNEA